MSDTKFLINRRGLWLFNWRVPDDCRHAFGNKRYVTKSLETHSLQEAQLKRTIAHAECLKIVHTIRNADSNEDDPRAKFRAYLQSMEHDNPEDIEAAWLTVQDKESEDPDDLAFKEALRVKHTGFKSELAQCTLKDALKAHNEDKADRVAPKTISTAKRAVTVFLEFMGQPDVILHEVTRRQVKEFIKVTQTTNSGKTVSNRINHLSAIFKVALDEGLIDEDKRNPFEGHRVSRADTKSFERFSDSELKEVFKLTEKYKDSTEDYHRYMLPRLGYATGCRIEELCSLQRAQLREDKGIHYIAIADGVDAYQGKTLNAGRRIPVHSSLVEELKAWRDSSDHKLLFPVLESKRADGKLGDKYSKQFSRVKKAVGVTTRNKGFHSFRVHMATNLERAEVPESRAVWLLGHNRNLSLSYGLYSDGPALEQLREDVEKAIVWP